MHAFSYRDGTLHCESVDLESLAREHGTPLYVYSKATLLDHYRRLDSALWNIDHMICYAVKANSNLAILDLFADEQSGFDIVSGGELYRVIKAGGDPGKCTFAGVGKTRPEIEYALDQGIYSFNVESEAELRFINQIAGEMKRKAPVAVRVNPNVDAGTHAYISTGKKEDKFGIDFDQIEDLYARVSKELPHIQLRGIQMHIGSQLTRIGPFVEATKKVAPLAAKLKADHGIEFFSIGGGIGIVYQNALNSGHESWWHEMDDIEQITIDHYAESLLPILEPLNMKILLEPGRFIAGNAGALVTEVLYEKNGAAKTFEIIDAGMSELIRPALYSGHHDIIPVTEPDEDTPSRSVDIVGPICESGDFFAKDRELPAVKQGDLLAVLSAGAYGFVMASNYNSRPFPAEILVDGSHAQVVRKRQSWDDLIAGEYAPKI
ncbi:MAG: diaminopimelate decarboxylase [Verrucomicrobiota bacterium]